MTKKACAFTGHRTIPKVRYLLLKKTLINELRSLIEEGFNEFIAGGALGFDTLAETTVLNLKKEYPDITLRLILPCKNQDSLWKEKDRELYREILEYADSVEYVTEEYTDGCMQERNRRMVDNASAVVAFYDGRHRSGTAMTVNYAVKKGVWVINLF